MSCYSRANKVCATCAHWGGNRNSVAGGFQVIPTSSTEKIVSRRRADHSYDGGATTKCSCWLGLQYLRMAQFLRLAPQAFLRAAWDE